MEKIDIITPVYNVEKFLPQCIDSILAQTYTNWHLILIDDGSTDDSGLICEEYARKDTRIKVIHQKYAGVSAARNRGLDAATGDYISFIDSDDYVVPEMLEKLYMRMKEESADLSICGFIRVNEAGTPFETGETMPIRRDKWPGIKGLEKMEQKDGFCYVLLWNKLYKREIFEDFRFPEGKLHEDEAAAPHVFFRAAKVACLPEILYFYRRRSGSIMTTKNFKNVGDYLDILWNHEEFAKKHRLKDYQNRVREKLWAVTALYTQWPGVKREQGMIYKRRLTKLLPWLFFTRSCYFRRKLRLLVWEFTGINFDTEKRQGLFRKKDIRKHDGKDV